MYRIIRPETFDISLSYLLRIGARRTYSIRMADDSMNRVRIFERDLLIVDKGAESIKGQPLIGVVFTRFLPLRPQLMTSAADGNATAAILDDTHWMEYLCL
ncbi:MULTISPECIES: hypothetical protein [Pseudomonas]|uniref:hypothetical protein n=1 Tax=Pseudomonas TaxID=286 RepID=UPI0025803048|nr:MULTISPECIES: hypothetical protein [Pseudomonas]